MTTVYNKNGVPFNIDNIATDLNGKADIDGLNASFPVVTETYVNGNSGYMIFSPDENGNRRCIQWGVQNGMGGSYAVTTVYLLKELQTPYVVQANILWAESWYTGTFNVIAGPVTDIVSMPTNITSTTFQIQAFSTHYWRVDGYLA